VCMCAVVTSAQNEDFTQHQTLVYLTVQTQCASKQSWPIPGRCHGTSELADCRKSVNQSRNFGGDASLISCQVITNRRRFCFNFELTQESEIIMKNCHRCENLKYIIG
jgi:hypothetical protein